MVSTWPSTCQVTTLPCAPEPLETPCKRRAGLLLCPQCSSPTRPQYPMGNYSEPVTCPGPVSGLNSEENGRKTGNVGCSSSSCLELWILEELLKMIPVSFWHFWLSSQDKILHMMLCVISKALSRQRAQCRPLRQITCTHQVTQVASYEPSDTYRTHLREVISPEPNLKKKCRRGPGRTRVSLVNRRDRTTFGCSQLPHFASSLKCLPQWIFAVPPEPSQGSKFQETDGISISVWHQMCTPCTVALTVPSEWTRRDLHQSQRKPCI